MLQEEEGAEDPELLRKTPVALPAPLHPGGSAFAWTDPTGSKWKSKAQQGHGRLSAVPSCRSSFGSPKPPHGTGRSDVCPCYPVCLISASLRSACVNILTQSTEEFVSFLW